MQDWWRSGITDQVFEYHAEFCVGMNISRINPTFTGEEIMSFLKKLLFGDPRSQAAREGDIAKMQQLLDQGLDVNETTAGSDPALFHAAGAGQVEMVEFLLKNGAEVDGHTNKFDLTPLMQAASFGRAEVIKILLAHGADVNARDSVGKTPLDKAIEPALEIMHADDKEGSAELIRQAGGESGI